MGMATRLSHENRGHLTSLESRLRQTVVKMTHRRQEHFYFDFKHANERLPTGLSIGGHDLPLDGGSAWRPVAPQLSAPRRRREAPTASECRTALGDRWSSPRCAGLLAEADWAAAPA